MSWIIQVWIKAEVEDPERYDTMDQALAVLEQEQDLQPDNHYEVHEA